MGMGAASGSGIGGISGAYRSIRDRLGDVFGKYTGDLFSSEWAEWHINSVTETINNNIENGWTESDVTNQSESIDQDFRDIKEYKEAGGYVQFAQ